MTNSGQALVYPGARCFPLYHIVAHGADDFAGIANNEAARRYFFAAFEEAQRTDDTLVADFHIVHDDRVHTD